MTHLKKFLFFKKFFALEKDEMPTVFHDDFHTTRLLTTTFDVDIDVGQFPPDRTWIPADWIRGFGYTGMAWGLTNGQTAACNVDDDYSYATFGSVGSDTGNPTRRPLYTYAINENLLMQTLAPSGGTFFTKTYYYLRYNKPSNGSTIDISNCTQITFSGLGRIHSTSSNCTYEEVTVKPTFYSTLGLIVSKLTGGSLIISSGANSITFPLSLLTADPLFNPQAVHKIRFDFRVGRNLIPADNILLIYSFWVGDIILS